MKASAKRIQVLSKNFYISKKEHDFTKLCTEIQPMVFAVSMNVLKDYDKAMINVNDVLLKIYNSFMGIKTSGNAADFLYDDEKPFVSYVFLVTHNKAKMKYNKYKNSPLKMVLEASAEEEDSNQLVDVLPGDSKHYFDLNSEIFWDILDDDMGIRSKYEVIKNGDGTFTVLTTRSKNYIPLSIRNKVRKQVKNNCDELEYNDRHLKLGLFKGKISNVPFTANQLNLCVNKCGSQNCLSHIIFGVSKKINTSYITLSKSHWCLSITDGKSADIADEKFLAELHKWLDYTWKQQCDIAPKRLVLEDAMEEEFEVGEYLHNNNKLQYEKILNIVKNFSSSDVLLEAITSCQNYRDIGEKSNHSSSAIKTRVFRGKRNIQKIIQAEILYDKIITCNKIYTGNIKLYHDNGKTKMEGSFINSVRNGKFTFYFDNGCVKKIISYKNGNLNGEYREYNIKGDLIMEGQYENNNKHGLWRTYNEKMLLSKTDYWHGVMGYYEKINDNGDIINGIGEGKEVREVVMG